MQIAKEALHMGMDEVWLMVAKDTPLKDRKLTPASHRAAMGEKSDCPLSSYTLLRIGITQGRQVIHDRYGARFAGKLSGFSFLLADRFGSGCATG